MDELKVDKTINILVLALLAVFVFTKVYIFFLISVLLLVNNIWFADLNRCIVTRWLKFSHGLERVNSSILLSFIFCFVVIPVAYLYRMCNKKMVTDFKENKRTSYFDAVNHIYSREDFLKQW